MNSCTSSLDNGYTFLFLYLYCMILYFLYWYWLTHLLFKDIEPFMEPLKNQFLGLFLGLCCFLLFISDLPFLCYLLYFYYSLLFFCFFFLFSSFLFSFCCCFSSSSFFSFFFCFCHPDFPCFGLHCFPHFSEHLVIFTSPVLQSIS